MRIRIVALLVCLTSIIIGCTVGPDYKAPNPDVPDDFSEIGSATQPALRNATMPSAATQASTQIATTQAAVEAMLRADYEHWWTTFNDVTLDKLIVRAKLGNLDLMAAEARVMEAKANRGIVVSQLFPEIDAQGNYTHARSSLNTTTFSEFSSFSVPGVPAFTINPVSDVWQAGFDASWEIDVFGGTRRGVESADASIQAAVEDRRDVLVSLMAEVALNYVELRGAQRELSIANHNLQSQQQTLGLTRSKAEGGLIPYLNVAQQEAQVASTSAAIPTLETQTHQNIHALSVLLGKSPGVLEAELAPESPIPVGPTSVPPGVPSDLVRRRPDVRRAERQLAAQTAQIGVATADLFPKFSITGALGTEASQFHQLFDWQSRFYSLAPGVTWDIFDAGRVKSNIRVQTARQCEFLIAYRKAVLQSLQDVDDTLIAYNREQVRLQALRDAVDANQRAVDLSTELFEKGSKDFLSVLDAQRDLFAAQDLMARSEEQVSADLIALYKALGGGWRE